MEKLLASLLILALSFAPLSSMSAAFVQANASNSGTAGQMTSMGSHHAGLTIDNLGQQKPCSNCPQQHDCQGTDCSAGHCPACHLALISGTIVHLADIASTPYRRMPDASFASLSTPTLYRPPKC